MRGDAFRLRDDEEGHADSVEPQAARGYDVNHPVAQGTIAESFRKEWVFHTSVDGKLTAPYSVGVTGRVDWLSLFIYLWDDALWYAHVKGLQRIVPRAAK